MKYLLIAFMLFFAVFSYALAEEGAAGPSSAALVVREFKLKYLLASDAAEAIKPLLSERGRVIQGKPTNSLVLTDTTVSVERIKSVLELIDRRPAQVMIEGKIVEVTTSFSRELGINWGGGYKDTQVMGELGKIESGFSINPPGGDLKKDSPTGGITLELGRLAVDNFTLNLRISALEDSGNAKVLSSPQILVLENEEASISSGEELVVPVSETATVVARNGYKTDKPLVFEAKIELTVRPRVIDGDNISMTIATKREEFDYNVEVKGFPSKLSKTAKTELIVKDGETVVIGGVNTKRQKKAERGVPFLSKIPLLGALFRERSRAEDSYELLIFLTPRIMQ